MLFYYIRHGDPIYDPDSLTPLGARQAEALAKRLAIYGLDEIYASTSERAKLTAKPTCEILKKDLVELDFANEKYAWQDFTALSAEGRRQWLCVHEPTVKLFADPQVIALGNAWYTHPAFAEVDYKSRLDRIHNASVEFFRSLGYERIEGTATYKVIQPSDKRVAMFAHHGFGLLFLSDLLGIPYPQFCLHFDIMHTGMTAIAFENKDGFCIPRILTLSNDAHLFREGLPTRYGKTDI